MIYITRPYPDGEALTQLLTQAGLPALPLPLFEICPGADLPNLQERLDRLAPADSVIMVAPQVIHMLKQHHPPLYFPRDNHYFAVGERTATLFSELTGLAADYPKQENSEGLLQLLLATFSVAGRKFLILRGENGRELLGSSLTAAQAQIEYWQCYRRQPIHYTSLPILHKNRLNHTQSEHTQSDHILLDHNQLDHNQLDDHSLIVITSVAHLLQLEQLSAIIQKKKSHLLVTSERILAHAKQLGWPMVHLATSANNAILAKTVITLYPNL